MTLTPLIDAGLIIIFHTMTALMSLILGIFMFARPKGTDTHRLLGRIWMVAMLGVVATSFMIFEIRLIGPFSPIHLLSLFALWSIWSGWQSARQHNHRRHATSMILLWVGALGLNFLVHLAARPRTP